MSKATWCLECDGRDGAHTDACSYSGAQVQAVGPYAQCVACGAGSGNDHASGCATNGRVEVARADEYEAFLAAKRYVVPAAGFTPTLPVSDPLFPFQKDLVRWALERGRAAIYGGCGTGKTIEQLEWARHVAAETRKPTLILAPLAVAQQTIREGQKFNIEAHYALDGAAAPDSGIVVTNYERLDRFDPGRFGGVVIDEASILKSYQGSTKQRIVNAFAGTHFRLACSATPAPNDHLELGNQSEFLGVLTSHEMIARWFISDQSEFGTYRLKGHAVDDFWDWCASWARCFDKPSDLDTRYSDAGYVLPDLRMHRHVLEVDLVEARGANLFRMPEMSATAVHQERRRTVLARAARVADIVAAEPDEQWLIWCETDYESDALRAAMPSAVDVRGSMSLEKKEEALLGFCDGKVRVLITKPKLAGLGLNFQNCARVAFVSATYSYEAFYQAIRRAWRFGQTRPVDVHMVMAATESNILDVLHRKQRDHEAMKLRMFAAMRRAQRDDNCAKDYRPTMRVRLPAWLTGASP